MLQAVSNAFKLPDLRRKIVFTLGVLVIFRLAAHIPVPGVNLEALREIFARNQLLGLLDMFSGGALSNFSVMAMGVYPYITASIVLQLLQPIIPRLAELAKEGEAGRNKMNQYTLLLTVPLAFLNAFGQASLLASSSSVAGAGLLNFGFTAANWLPTLSTLITLTAGTMLAVWLGELIDQQGVGNGISIIIFGGIVTDIPSRVGALLIGGQWAALLLFIVITLATVAVIVFIQEGQRRIPVQYAKRVRGTKVYGGQSTHIPLQVNAAGMIPLILAVSLLIFPGVIASYLVNVSGFVGQAAQFVERLFSAEGAFYWIAYFVLVIIFTYFYTDIVFQQQNLAENLQRQGGFILGIRPGKRTADYLSGVVRRITLVGALFLGFVAILPWPLRLLTNQTQTLVTSTGLLIVVGVVLDTMKQLEAQLLMRHYEGFIRR
ncbi:MAG: preprotein translocase subunit SecY [Anaerolineae bacterium]